MGETRGGEQVGGKCVGEEEGTAGEEEKLDRFREISGVEVEEAGMCGFSGSLLQS